MKKYGYEFNKRIVQEYLSGVMSYKTLAPQPAVQLSDQYLKINLHNLQNI